MKININMNLKRIISSLALLSFFWGAKASTLINGLYYNLNSSDLTATVTSAGSSISNKNYVSGTLSIPETVTYEETTYSVSEIEHHAFQGCTALTKVIISDSVKKIGYYAFYNCDNLTSVSIGNSVSEIESNTFRNCRKLTSINIPEGVTKIGETAFLDCTSLDYIEIPNSVKSIGQSAFSECTKLSNLIIGNSVTEIGSYAFYDCSALKTVTIPNSVTSIGKGVFQKCTELTSVTIPNSVTSISNSAFYECIKLSNLIIGNSVKTIEDYAFYGCSGLKSVEIPNSVTEIGYEAFEDCSGLTSVTIPNFVTEIGGYAFAGCSALTTVTIPNSVTSIGSRAFFRCNSLTSIEYNAENCTTCGSYDSPAFPSSFTTLIIGSQVKNIPDYAFYSCSGLTNVTIPNSVISIGRYAFQNCSGLTSVIIGNSVTSIGNFAFRNCSGLTSMTIPNSVTSIGSYAFRDCSSLTSFMIPNSVKSIGDFAFHGCSGLVKSAYPSSLSNPFSSGIIISYPAENSIVEDGIIYGENKSSLYFVSLSQSGDFSVPASVNSIEDMAFYGCNGITSLTIEDCTETLTLGTNGSSTGMFSDCPLETVYAGRNLEYDASPANGYSPFYNQTALTSFTLGENVSYLKDNFLRACDKVTGLTLPGKISEIGNAAFYDCKGLTFITLPASLASIRNNTFRNCSGLKDFTIPASVNSIEDMAFYGCSGITSLTIEDSSETLTLGNNGSSKGMFSDCPLETVYVGRNIMYEPTVGNGYSPFYKKAFSTLGFGNLVTTIENYCFAGCDGLDIVELPNSVENIGKNAFANCINMKAITFPSHLKEIQDNGFNGCSSLVSIELPESVESLGENTFAACSKLNNVSIAASVNSIGSRAFYGCSSLKVLTIVPGDNPIEVGTDAFPNTLESLVIGRNLSSTGVFADQKNLNELTIDDNVISLPASSFRNCLSLSELTLPINLKELGDNCFGGCSSLKAVTYTPSDNFVSFSESVFDVDVYRNADLIISNTRKTIEATSDESWNRFYKIFYNEENTKYIPLTWNSPLTVKSIYTSESGCLMPAGEEINLKAGLSEQVIFNGEDIYDILNSESGYNYNPEESWTLNRFYCYGGVESDKIRIVELESPETLFDELGLKNIQNIEELTIIGDINGTDVMTLNRMLSLRYLNLQQANIVEGGQTYREDLKTDNNKLGSYFFYDLENLQTLVLPNSVTIISANALAGKSSLKNLIIGNKTSTIGNSALSGCSALEAIVIPSSVTEIGNNVFSGCSSLISVTYNDTTTAINLGYNTNSTSGTGHGLFYDSPLQSLYLGRNINYTYDEKYPSKYGYSAFYNQNNLKKLEIGDKVSALKSYIFYNCSGLQSVIIPPSVKDIGDYAFNNCTGLLSAIIGEGGINIGAYSFAGCKALKKVEFGDGESIISYYGFSGCSSLNEINLPNGLTFIGDNSFENCALLSKLKIPSSVLSLGNNVFSGCNSLTELEFEDRDDDISMNDKSTYYPEWSSTNYTHGSTSSYTYTIPVFKGDVISFEAWADSESNDKLTVTLNGSNIVSLSGQNKTQTYSKTYTSDATLILDVRYTKNNSLSYYSDKGGIRNLKVSGPMHGQSISIGTNNGNSYFADCPLEEIYVGRNLVFSEGSNNGYSPFYGQEKLRSAVIGKNVKGLQSYYFANCSILNSVILPETMNSIGSNAFQNCTSLVQVMVPDSLEKIDNYVFDGCASLKKLKLGVNLKSINNTAFRNCSEINTIYSYALLPPVITSTVFEKVDKNLCELFVRKGRLVYYWTDPVWKEFLNLSDDIIELTSLPSVSYGDAPINLLDYAPEGSDFVYESSNPNVALIDDGMLKIIGAGEATIGISYEDPNETPMNVLGYMRQFIVDKADLKISTETIEIYEGQTLPELKLVVEGLCYEDTVDDLEELPVASCAVSSESSPGEYSVSFTGGASKNYNFIFGDSKVVVKERRKVNPSLIETAVYGDAPIDLSEFTPEGENLIYSVVDSSIAEVNENILFIKGAGSVTITIALADDNGEAIVIDPERILIIDKAELEIGVEDITISFGETIPPFVLKANGLVYDDTLDDVGELPVAYTDATEISEPGEYPIYLEGGKSDNYNLSLTPGVLSIVESFDSYIESIIDAADEEIVVYNLNGIKIYYGTASEARLTPGTYIIVSTSKTYKVLIK